MWIAAAMLAATVIRTASAQSIVLEPDVVRAVQLSPEHVDKIGKFVDEHLPGLDDPARRGDARKALLKPLEDSSASMSFRTQYTNKLQGKLQEMIAGKDDIVVINGLVLAGELATGPAIELVLPKLAAENRPQVRYQAAYAIRRTFEALSLGAGSMPPAEALNLARRVGSTLAQEKDGLVVRSLVEAGLQASRIQAIGEDALLELIRASAAQADAVSAKKLDATVLTSLVKAGQGVRDDLAKNAGQMRPDTLRTAADFGGRLIAIASCAASGNAAPPGGSQPAIRELMTQASSVGESIWRASSQALAPNVPVGNAAESIADWLKRNSVQGDATFVEEAARIIGAQGALTKAPFNQPAQNYRCR